MLGVSGAAGAAVKSLSSSTVIPISTPGTPAAAGMQQDSCKRTGQCKLNCQTPLNEAFSNKHNKHVNPTLGELSLWHTVCFALYILLNMEDGVRPVAFQVFEAL